MLTHVCDSQNISAFSLVNDTIWQGLYTDYTRAEFATGGFTTYQGAQVSLRGRRSTRYFKDVNYVVSYALARNEAINGAGRVEFRAAVNDNLKWNSKQNYGPNGLDYTHILRVAGTVGMPGGFWLSPLVSFRTAPPISIFVPNFGGAISGTNGFFGTDLNGDGTRSTSPRSDILPGLDIGQFGRSVKSFQDLNQVINAFNQNYAAAASQAAPAPKKTQ